MLEVKNLYSGYPKKNILRDVSIKIYPEQVTVLLGPNGCGKSTLLKSICGIVPAEKGEILLDGQSLK